MYFSATPGLAFTKVMSHTGPSWKGRAGAAWAIERLGSSMAENASTAMARIMFFLSWLLFAFQLGSKWPELLLRGPPLPWPGSFPCCPDRSRPRGMRAMIRNVEPEQIKKARDSGTMN
jgi:hypothetical protein